MSERTDAVLVLEDGTIFKGKSIGQPGKVFGEVVFNTSLDGYQEIFTDPSNYGQIIVMTVPHVGNYGTAPEDATTDYIQCEGIVVKKFSKVTSRQRAEMSLEEHFNKDHKIGISDVDTRTLVRHIRTNGAMNGVISTEENFVIDDLLAEVQGQPKMEGLELASKVSCKKAFVSPATSGNATFKVAILDLGSSTGIMRRLNQMNGEVKVFPINSSLQDMEAYQPDAYVLSSGPGDPRAMENILPLIQEIIALNKPVLGINLGHLLLALSQGVKVEKMLHGHRGVNHPIMNHKTGKGEMTTQNHSFVVERISAEDNENIEITHSHLNDNTVAGIAFKNRPVFSVQYHPEGAVGPHDSLYLIEDFIQLINKN